MIARASLYRNIDINNHDMATYAQFQITNYDDLVAWIKRQFGFPLIQVELTDDQILSCINDAVEVYTEYVIYDESYMGLNMDNYEEGVGIKLPDNVMGIFNINDDGFGGGINSLFSIPNQMWNAGMLPRPGGAGGGWLSYETALQSMKMAKVMTGSGFEWNFNERTKYLSLLPDPTQTNAGGEYIVVGVTVVRPEDQLYGERLVKRLALAYSKKILGKIRGTFQNVPLLAGANINETIGEEGTEEETNLMEELKNINPPPFLIG